MDEIPQITCPSCGETLPPTEKAPKKCTFCGKPLDKGVIPKKITKICPVCDRENRMEEPNCVHCGTSLGAGAQGNKLFFYILMIMIFAVLWAFAKETGMNVRFLRVICLIGTVFLIAVTLEEYRNPPK